MKNSKKLLVLIPVLGLFLSGCSFQEVKHSIGESWIGQHILHPVYDPIRDLINGGKKEEKKEEEKPSEDTPSGEDEGKQEEDKGPKFPSDKIAAFFKKYGLSDVEFPAYTLSNEGASFEDEEDESYADYGFVAYYVYANKSTREEMDAYAVKLEGIGFELEESGGDYIGDLGETGLSASVVDYLDDEEDPYVGIAFVYEFTPEMEVPETATGVVEDFVKFVWQTVEEGDVDEPTEQGVVYCHWAVQLNSVENPEDSDECLTGALTAFASETGFPSYLRVAIQAKYTPNLLAGGTLGASEIFFITSDYKLGAYMYDYYDSSKDAVMIVFCAGPAEVFFDMSE